EREEENEAMPEDAGWAVRANGPDEDDDRDDDKDGEKQIAARRHPSHHGNEQRMQGEEERQQQRGQPLVIQSEQEPENTGAAHDAQNQIGKMVDKRTRSADEGIEHETNRLKRPVKAAVGP